MVQTDKFAEQMVLKGNVQDSPILEKHSIIKNSINGCANFSNEMFQIFDKKFHNNEYFTFIQK